MEEELIAPTIQKRPTIKHSHALRLALENELNLKDRRELKRTEKKLQDKAQENRSDGGKGRAAERRETAAARMEALRKMNGNLLATIRPKGRRTASNVAGIILENWAQRGDGGTPPSRSTLLRWLEILSMSS